MAFLQSSHLPLAGISVFLTLLIYIISVLRKPISKVPGPWHTRFVDLSIRYHVFHGRRAQYVHELHQRYGPIVRLGPNEVDVCDIKAYKEIYTVRETFVKSYWYKILTGGFVDTIFTTSDTNFHRRIRRLLSGPLSEASLASSHDFIATKVNLAIQRMKEEMAEKGAADVYKWWLFMATDIIGELTFGKSFEMLDKTEKNQYMKDVSSINLTAILTALYPIPQKLKFLPLAVFKKPRQRALNMIKYSEESLARHKRLVEEDSENVQPTLFSKVYAASEKGEISFKEMRDQGQTYIVAGSDTTAITLTYTVWAVCRHPELKKQLAREIGAMSAEPSEEELRGAHLLAWTIEEGLRLYGAAQVALPRLVPAQGATLTGYFLEGGTTVAAQAYSLQRDPEVYPDPWAFNPWRWEKASKEMKDQLVAFGGGARICIGLHLAKMELRLGLFKFFKAFPEAQLKHPDDDMTMNTFFVNMPAAGRCLVTAS